MSRALVTALLLAAPLTSVAADFDLASFGNPQTDMQADARYRIFARQLAAMLTSVNLMPPETLGHSAFAVSAEVSGVFLGAGRLPVPNAAAWNAVPSLHVRKGLAYGTELGARVAYLWDSRMVAATFEGRVALTEGFRYVPDIGLRGFITKLINGRDFDLTSGGLDVGVGKQFGVAGMVTLTPYAGWSMSFVGSSTSTVDFRPTRSLMESDLAGEQFKDYYVFTSVAAADNINQRFYGGVRLIAGVVQLGAELSYVVPARFDETKNRGGVMVRMSGDVPGTLAINGTLGLDF